MSVKITQDSTNDCIFTLSEKTTVGNPYYLFSFTCDTQKTIKNFLCADISVEKNRYNEFTIIEVGEGGTENLLVGEVRLNPPMFWSYTIYAQTSPTNLDPDLADEIVETGKIRIFGDTEVPVTEYDSEDKEFKVYQNNL